MKSIILPAGTRHVPFGDLAHLIADALWPDAGDSDERNAYGAARVNLDGELAKAVKSEALPIKDPLTFGPHTYPIGAALKRALVTVDDLREFVAGRGLSVLLQCTDCEAGTTSTSNVKPVPPGVTTIAEKSPDALASPRVMHGHRVWRLSEAIDEIAKALNWHSSQRDKLMAQAVKDATAGALKVRDLYAGGILKKGDHMSELLDSLFSRDVNEWLDKIEAPFPYRLPEAETRDYEIEKDEEFDFAVVATRQQLIDAFGVRTAMNMSWFNKVEGKLLAARRHTGQGGRGQAREPYFCPYQVMLWLFSKPRKGSIRRRLEFDTGWRILEEHFPTVYNQYSVGDTRTESTG